MNRFLLIFALAGSLWGQSVVTATGSGHVTGVAQSGGKVIFPLPGPPTQYAARTDTCAVGTEAGCTGGRAVTLNFQMRSTDAPPFAAMTLTTPSPCAVATGGFNTGVTDPDFGSHLIMVSDPCSKNLVTTFELGELNDGTDVFSYDSSMFFYVSNNAGPFLVYLNASAIRSQTCTPSDTTKCLINSAIVAGAYTHGSCSSNCQTISSPGARSWSRVSTEPNVIYEMESDFLHINKLTICRTGHSDAVCGTGSPATTADHFTRTAYANFADPTYGVLPTSYTSTWTGTFGVSDDGTITIASGGAGDWAANTQYYALANDTNTTPTSFIFPQTNNGGTPKDAFQAVSSGFSGSVEVNWTTTSEPTLAGCCTQTFGTFICDGSGTTSSSIQSCSAVCGVGGTSACAQWQNIGSINGQGPGFDQLNFTPASALALGSPSAGYSRINTRISKVYRGFNEGTAFPSAGVQDPSGSLTTDDGVMCSQFGYTLDGTGKFCLTAMPWAENFTQHDTANLASPLYSHISITGGGSNPPSFAYSPVSVPNSLNSNTNYRGAWNSGATYVANDAVYDPLNVANLYVCIAPANCSGASFAPTGGGSSPGSWQGAGTQFGPIYEYSVIWQKNTTIVRPYLCRGVTGHIGESDCGGHGSYGYLSKYGDVDYTSFFWARPVIPATGNLGAVPNPGVNLLNTPIPGDDHGTYRNSGLNDLPPMGSVRTNVPTSNYALINAANPGISAGYGEVVAMQTNGSQVFYRFAHTLNDGLENDFSAQNNIGAISQDGNWLLWGTDVMGTRGSRSAAWTATHSYPIGTPIFPTTNNTGNFDYVATAIGGSTAAGGTGTSGSSQPNWDSSCTTTCTDGTSGTQITWTRQAGACNQARQTGARYQPASGITMAQGDLMYPVTNNGSGNIFQAQAAVPGTTSGSTPNWGTTCGSYNQTCSYGPVVLTNIGPSDCRADVVLVDLVSAH
jgi:hypothetical protein